MKYLSKVVLERFHSSDLFAGYGWAMSQKIESCENVFLVNCNCTKIKHDVLTKARDNF